MPGILGDDGRRRPAAAGEEGGHERCGAEAQDRVETQLAHPLPDPPRERLRAPEEPETPLDLQEDVIRGGQADLGGELHGPGGDPRERLSLGALIALEDPQSPLGRHPRPGVPGRHPRPDPVPAGRLVANQDLRPGPRAPHRHGRDNAVFTPPLEHLQRQRWEMDA